MDLRKVADRIPQLSHWRWDLIGLFALALFLRAITLWSVVDFLGTDKCLVATPDTRLYLTAASALAHGTDGYHSAFLVFGPGFPLYLSAFLRLFGDSAIPILIAQIILSGLTCLMIYRLSQQVLGDYTISVVAAVIAAFSLTSISLSCVILSDTLYLFLFLLSLVLFIDGLNRESNWRLILAGALLGFAVLTRTIGQFWPIPLALIGLLVLPGIAIHRHAAAAPKAAGIRRIALCLIVAIGMMIGWGARNYATYGVPAIAMTSAGGPANVAAMTLEAQTGVPYRQIEDSWFKDESAAVHRDTLSLREQTHLLRRKTLEVLQDSPVKMLQVYLNVVWENLTAREELHEDTFPKVAQPWAAYLNVRYRPFILAAMGLLVLLLLRRFRAASVLTLIYLYYALMIGFTKWQGSRLFYPGLAAETILNAIAIVFAVRAAVWLCLAVNRRWRIAEALTAWFDDNPRSGRHYAIVAIALIGGALLWLFRGFVFSDQMLKSVDVLGIGLSHHRFMLSHFSHFHQFPGWNPCDTGGVPVIESISGAVFYPLALFDYLGYIPRMIGFNFLFHFVAGGFFAFLAARQLKLSPPAAMVVAVIYGCAPLILSWVAPGHDGKIFAAAWFPLMVLFLDRALSGGRLRDAAWCGLVFALLVVTPHLQMAFYAAVFAIIYSLWSALGRFASTRSLSDAARRLWPVMAGLAIGIGLSAVQWLPATRYIATESPRAYEQTGVDYASTFSLHPEECVSLAIPEFCGLNQLDGPKTYWGRNSFKDNSESFGFMAVLLAALGLVLPGNRRKYFWLGVSLLVICYALGSHTPVLGLLVKFVPFMGQMRAPSTAMFVALFCTAILAGIGVDNLLSAVGRPGLIKRVNYFFLVTIAVLLAISCLMILKGKGFLGYYSDFVYPEMSSESARAVQSKSLSLENLPFLQAGLWRALGLLLGTFLVYRLFTAGRRPYVLAIAFAFGSILAGFGIVSRCISTIDPAVYWEPKPVTEYLKQHAGIDRVVGFGLNQTSLLIGTVPIQSTIGYNSRPVMWYYRLLGEDPARNLLNPRFANLAGTRYIVTPNRADFVLRRDSLGPIPLDTLALFPDCVVLENRNALPRTFLVDSFRVMDSLWPALVETANGQTDLSRVAVLEQPPDLPVHPSSDSTGNARILYYGDDSVSVSVSCPANRLLILTDVYYSAWHASIDGRPARILRAYGAFRAVPVPAGNHRVDFVFSSKYVRWGTGASLATVCGLGLTFAVGYIHARRRRNRALH